MRALTCLVTAILCSNAASAAGTRPEDVIAAFFGPGGIADRSAVYTGEMLSHFKDVPTLGEKLPPGTLSVVRSLSRSATRAVYRVTLSGGGATDDWYAYLSLENGRWKLEAVRTLALMAIPAMVLAELERAPQLTEEQRWQRDNLRLMLQSDAELRRFVRDHLRDLERASALAIAGKTDEVRAAARKLHLNSVAIDSGGRVQFVIGGMTDNTVGFLYVPESSSPPPMTPDEYILVERVTGRWYVFKTT